MLQQCLSLKKRNKTKCFYRNSSEIGIMAGKRKFSLEKAYRWMLLLLKVLCSIFIIGVVVMTLMILPNLTLGAGWIASGVFFSVLMIVPALLPFTKLFALKVNQLNKTGTFVLFLSILIIYCAMFYGIRYAFLRIIELV